MTEPPRTDTTLHAVYCAHCANPRPLLLVGPGVVVMRERGKEQRIDGLTPQARVVAKCFCGASQVIVVPPKR